MQSKAGSGRGYSLLLFGTALFAVGWAVARAALQSITLDEADTYLFWAAPSGYVFWPSSNNHILNSLLMRFSTVTFGLSPLTVRLPALLGGALYVSAALYLCRHITARAVLQWSLFVCLVFNPFVFDFLVAARGFSMALGFLAWALALPAAALQRETATERALLRAAAISSICGGLAFAANFSFAFGIAGLLLMSFLWMRLRLPRGVAGSARLLGSCMLPGALAAAILCARTVLQFPKSQLFYGTQSLVESLKSMIGPTLYELNPHLMSARLYAVVAPRRNLLLPLLGAAVVCQLVAMFRSRRELSDGAARWHLQFGTVLAGGSALALLAHWIGFHAFGLLMPKDRTGLYLVLSATLITGLLAALRAPSKMGGMCQKTLEIMLLVMAFYFLGCLRLSYFREWKYDADVSQAYPVAAGYARELGARDVPSHWFYTTSLTFYRKLDQNGTIDAFPRIGDDTAAERNRLEAYPAGQPVYVLYYPEDRGFLEREGLRVVYHGKLSDIVVAVKPGPGIPEAAGPEPMRDPVFWDRYRRSLAELQP